MFKISVPLGVGRHLSYESHMTCFLGGGLRVLGSAISQSPSLKYPICQGAVFWHVLNSMMFNFLLFPQHVILLMCLKQDPNKIHTLHFVDIAMSVKILNNSFFFYHLLKKTTSFALKFFTFLLYPCGVVSLYIPVLTHFS